MPKQQTSTERHIFLGGADADAVAHLARLLHAHPDIACCCVGSGGDAKLIAESADLNVENVELLLRRAPDRVKFIDGLSYMVRARWGVKRLFVDATPSNIEHVDEIFENWPNAKFIQVINSGNSIVHGKRRAACWADSLDETPEVELLRVLEFIGAKDDPATIREMLGEE